MKRIWMLVAFVLMFVLSTNAQHYNVTRNDYEQVNISFTTGDVLTETVKTDKGEFSKISMDGYYSSTMVGKPQLPVMAQMLQIPVCDSVIATVRNAQYVEVDASELNVDYAIIPAQPSYSKSYRGEREFVIDNETYARNAFYAEPLVRVEKAGIMRDVCLANIYVSPVAYNPVTKKFRIYKNVEVEVTYVNANIPATYELQSRYGSPMFQNAAQMVANPMPRTRQEFSQAPIKYLIIAHSMFMEDEHLTQFIQWKKRMGYKVELASTSDPNVGTTNASITAFIKSKYTNATEENPAPTFLLLVGDNTQIPAKNSSEENSHVTDLYFTTWTEGDNLPDCYYGRFSANNINELTPQIEKTLMYEQYSMPDPSYLGIAVLISGTDSYYSTTHADGQVNYIYNNYINTSSTTHNYTTVYKHNYNCNSQAASIRSEIGAGCGWTNYTAHGDVTEWYQPSFTASQVLSMNNDNKYGVMIGNCCLTGKFNQDCFAETLMRASHKGAMAYIGASEVSYWDEDVYWAVGNRSTINANMIYNANNLGAYDRLFHTHYEAQTNWTTCLSAFVQGGNLAVQASNSDLKKYYWEIYHVFGDPSVKPYMGIPATMSVTADNIMLVGATSYQVMAVPYAYVALTFNNELIGATFADASGMATITFNALSMPGEYELAVGAQNYIQFFKTVTVIVPEGPYVVATDAVVASSDSPINGSTIHWDLYLDNLGVSAASNVTASMTSLTPGYTVTQGAANVGNVSVGSTSTVNNAFTVTIPQNANDGDRAKFNITVNWAGGSSSKEVILTTMGPKLTRGCELQAALNASSFEPGDNATASFKVENIGHVAATSIVVDVTCNYSGVEVTTPAQAIASLDMGNSVVHNFNLQIGSAVPTISIVPIYFHMLYEGEHFVDTVLLTVGKAMETFETGDFFQFNWSQNSNPWTITNVAPYAGNYCARSKSGLGNSSKSSMSITINSVMDGTLSYFRKVSSEEGYDKFYLYFDGAKKDDASGNVGWTQVSIPVTAGSHTFKFSYEKDYSTASGSDCAWVDNIVFPGMGTRVVEDVQDNVGIEEHGMNNWPIAVYPNPTTGRCNMESNSVQIQDVRVYDIYGKLIKNVSVNDFSATLDLSSLSNGVYVVKIIGENQSVKTTKIIKQ